MDRGLIYGLYDHKGLRYIGQTIKSLELRLKQHLWYSSKNKSRLGCWLRSLDTPPTICVIEECLYEDLDKLELKWIKEFQRLGCDLVNSMVGCEKSKHHTHSEETKKKIGEATKRIHTGMKRTDETKKRISDSRKGIKLSEEHKRKLLEGKKKNPLSEESKNKISESNKGKVFTKKHKERISEANKKTIFIYDLETKIIFESCVKDFSSSLNVYPNSIRSRLTKYKDKIYRDRYYISREKSELKKLLKQLGI
jgi:hypothetical protein